MPNVAQVAQMLHGEMSTLVGTSMARLVLAAILGGAIGLEREIKHRPAGLRTNLFICLGAALFTWLSNELAIGYVGDHTRIAAQIIPGIGFIGAGTILHARKDLITGITSAATIFVVASVGMAVGGGLYLTSIFATLLILLSLYALGRLEESFSLKLQIHTYEVTGATANEITAEVNQILEVAHATMDNVTVAPTKVHVRVQFDVEGTRREQNLILHRLKQSPMLSSVASLGPVELE